MAKKNANTQAKPVNGEANGGQPVAMPANVQAAVKWLEKNGYKVSGPVNPKRSDGAKKAWETMSSPGYMKPAERNALIEAEMQRRAAAAQAKAKKPAKQLKRTAKK
jgi:hypothetical protein